MKTIIFQGCQWQVPEWAKFITKDDDGEVFCFSDNPCYNKEKGIWHSLKGNVISVGNVNCKEI